jgi:hypothetical protein
VALLTPQMQDLLTDGFKEIIDERVYERWQPIYTRTFKQDSSTKPNEDFSEVTGFGLVPAVSEHANITYDDPLQAFDTTFTPVKYGLGFEVSEEMIEDDQYGKVREFPEQLAQSVIETIEIVHANHYNNATSGSYTGGDGVALASASHPLVGGGTFSNVPTTANADLSSTSYEQALVDMSNWTDHRGKRIRSTPSMLITHTAQIWDAEKLFGSSQVPENANNAINPAMKRRVEVIEQPYFTDTDMWVLQGAQHRMTTIWRWRPRSGRDNVFSNNAMRFKTTFRFSSGWVIPFHIYINTGG